MNKLYSAIFLSLLICLCLSTKRIITNRKDYGDITIISYGNHNFYTNNRVYVGPGEYCTLGLLNGKVYDFTKGVPILISGAPTNVQAVYGGAHHYMFLDSLGNAWGADANDCGQLGIGNQISQATPQKILTDSSGNPFTNIIAIIPGDDGTDVTGGGGYWNTGFLKADGTLWVTGNVAGGTRGNGTSNENIVTRPVQIKFATGVIIVKASFGNTNIALSSTGDVYTWGGGSSYYAYMLAQGTSSPNYFTPTKISLPFPAIDISGVGFWNFAILNNGHTYYWGHQDYMPYSGLPSNQWTPQYTPRDITTYLNFRATPVHIYSNNASNYMQLSDGSLWAWGDNACGTIGNGVELNYASYCGYPFPYGPNNNTIGCTFFAPWSWDQGKAELIQSTPVQVGPGISNFDTVYTSGNLVYTCYAQTTDGSLYAWGRNKGGICNGQIFANQSSGQLQQYYPNALDVPWITLITPFSYGSTAAQVPSPQCLLTPNNDSGCSSYHIPNVAGPTAYAGSNQNLGNVTSTNLAGTATSSSNTFITSHIWKKISGPTNPIITLNSGLNPIVTGLSTGSYIFQLNIIDANLRKDSSQVTINVGIAPPPSNITGGSIKVKRGEKIKIFTH